MKVQMKVKEWKSDESQRKDESQRMKVEKWKSKDESRKMKVRWKSKNESQMKVEKWKSNESQMKVERWKLVYVIFIELMWMKVTSNVNVNFIIMNLCK